MIKAIAFDVDGTLYPNYQMYLCSLTSFISAPRLMYHFGKVRKEIRTLTYDGSLHDQQARLLSGRMNIPLEKAENLMERYLYRRWESSFRCIRPFSHVRETLLAIRRAGLKLGALSDFPIENKLRFLGLDDLFDVAITSEATGYLKPHHIPFLQLARRLETAPEELLYVGNSHRYDVVGASGVGMKTAWITGRKKSENSADFVFSSYKEFRRILFEGDRNPCIGGGMENIPLRSD